MNRKRLIRFTKHALERVRERHPDWTDNNCRDLAAMVIENGQLLPGNNGCKRYRYMGFEFVIKENNCNNVIITVV